MVDVYYIWSIRAKSKSFIEQMYSDFLEEYEDISNTSGIDIIGSIAHVPFLTLEDLNNCKEKLKNFPSKFKIEDDFIFVEINFGEDLKATLPILRYVGYHVNILPSTNKRFQKLAYIINEYVNKRSKQSILNCQKKLLDNGFGLFASY